MAAGDRIGIALEATSQEILREVLKNNENLEQNLSLINSTIGTDNPVSLDVMMTQLLYGTVFEYTKAGTYEIRIPANVSKIKVTACGGGGGGAYPYANKYGGYGGGGGGGADAVIDAEYNVTPQSTLNITVGSAGSAGTSSNRNGGNGGTTVIGQLVTLAGGKGAVAGDEVRREGYTQSFGGSGGSGGGNGGRSYVNPTANNVKTLYGETGKDGILGKGGSGGNVYYTTDGNYQVGMGGGGGGGSLGKGGNGAGWTGSSEIISNATAGTKGGGGGGGGSTPSKYGSAGKGGAGYAKIELIVTT